MHSPSVTPVSKKPVARVYKPASSSGPRPSKTLEAEVTIRAPSFASAKEEHPSSFITELVSSKNQFIPLAPLSTIAELPKQEPSDRSSATNLPVSIQASQGAVAGPQKDSDQVAKPRTPDSMEKHEVDSYRVEGSSRYSDSHEAASIPLPKSPVSGDPFDSSDALQSAAPTNGPECFQQPSPGPLESTAEATKQTVRPDGEERDTWASRLSSILPQAMFEQPTRQNTGMTDTRVSRAPSVAPGAYPESDSMEETPKPTPDSDMEKPETETGLSQNDPPTKSARPRKSVSIILPNADKDFESAKRTMTGSPTKGNASVNPARLNLEEKLKTGTEAEESPQDDTMVRNERSRQASQGEQHGKDTVREREELEKGNENTKSMGNCIIQSGTLTLLNPAVSAPHSDAQLSLNPSQNSSNRNGSPTSPASSIAASQEGTDKTDLLTLHERESLAPSDADNSSLNPLLSSSPRYARSSHFSESLGDNRSGLMPTEGGKAVAPNHETDADTPPIVDELSSISTTSSSTGSEAEKTGSKRESAYPFPPTANGEEPSHTESSQPPMIVIKNASEAESSRQSPPLKAPATTPVQGSSPRRRTTFIALGEPSDQGPVRLPMKRRKLYLRKARYHVLRQPVLNAALGRQEGAHAKSALKKLANGELIIIEPPGSL
ncbi:MAG: hypothetical protein Q9216_000586 [Gyalolechia sp. 2 TL-2023]